MMQVTLYQIIVWLIVGLAGGTLAGLIVKGEKKGFGLPANLGLGLVGALVGGWVFWLFDFLPSLDRISISLRDVVSALVGSILVLVLLWLWQRYAPSH
jgi:uncharacterized membrane protein YeaQ/YmgE (transglycosylase-associated protein family)